MRLLDAVAGYVTNKGNKVKLEHGPTGSHQSIGGAEVSHDVSAGFCRILAGYMDHNTGLVSEPQSRLFVGCLLHCATLATGRHIQKHG